MIYFFPYKIVEINHLQTTFVIILIERAKNLNKILSQIIKL